MEAIYSLLYCKLQRIIIQTIVASGTILFVEGSIGWNYSYKEIASRGHNMLYYNFQIFTCRAIVASRTILFVEGSIGWNNW